MLFNSFAFALFLPVVFLIFWLLPQQRPRAQNLFLIAAACVFYGWWDYRFLSLLFISSFVDFVAGILLDREKDERKRRWLVGASLGTNLGILGAFKYYGFFVQSLVQACGYLGWHLEVRTLQIVLPVGLSFYTFQSMAYTLDIYRRRLRPERNWIDFFAFVSFFPQLVAGPIQRAGDLLPQFQRPRELRPEEVRRGFEQALWGLCKKVVVADNLAGPVDRIFTRHASMGSITLWLGMLFFAVQIYCDFSGYSDIAIGISRFFGITLTRNFAYPYFARNLVEFWQRWHISLSTWFRDYLYIPLGGNRVVPGRRHFNLLMTFAVSGLWHGAKWTYVAWGLFHGTLYVAYVMWREKRPPAIERAGLISGVCDGLAMAGTFVVVLVSWVFFRADSLASAGSYLAGLVTRFGGGSAFVHAAVLRESFILCAGLLATEWIARQRSSPLELRDWPRAIRWPIYYAVIALILWKGNSNYVPFIYFNF